MKISLVGKEVTCRNLTQSVISFEISDHALDSCAAIVEAPQVEGPQTEIGNQDLIMVPAELEQCQLLVRLFGLRSSNHYEAVRMGPADGLIMELGRLHTLADQDVVQVS